MEDADEAASRPAQGAARGAESDAEAGEAGPAERGFFGRIFDAFNADGTVEGEEDEEDGAQGGAARQSPGLLNLRRMRVEDVAIPAVEIVSIPSDITKDGLVAVFRESGLTRLPVYKGTLDQPVGMIHLKDFALQYGFNGDGNGEFDASAMLRPLIYAPPSMPIGVLLQKMQSDRMHMALVIDEYGGVDGLVTIEDLIEQVIGQIEDEHDTEEDQLWTLEKPGVYLAFAKTPLEEFEEEIGMRLVDDDEDEEIDTLGGVVVLLTGRVPARGEVVPHPEGLQFEIVDADPRRIKRLRVRLAEPEEAHG
ncbi:transporter associated domain-containing protein [Profundibacterium mesophilum]|uniref:ATP-dependent Clp protease protease subunit n=1 Tax=Profundibacterium mesophilum KAUST100406-0324 TaxID=1037889 RepID=A0A921TCZ3_9RHOB|nr:hemolysin family protein [Profundibacterium mesophilum]KAF0676243.1 ATP-dependent Clp protease protease subunit [Profundibacterium mesophilum KAUST100406-0324]